MHAYSREYCRGCLVGMASDSNFKCVHFYWELVEISLQIHIVCLHWVNAFKWYMIMLWREIIIHSKLFSPMLLVNSSKQDFREGKHKNTSCSLLLKSRCTSITNEVISKANIVSYRLHFTVSSFNQQKANCSSVNIWYSIFTLDKAFPLKIVSIPQQPTMDIETCCPIWVWVSNLIHIENSMYWRRWWVVYFSKLFIPIFIK